MATGVLEDDIVKEIYDSSKEWVSVGSEIITVTRPEHIISSH